MRRIPVILTILMLGVLVFGQWNQPPGTPPPPGSDPLDYMPAWYITWQDVSNWNEMAALTLAKETFTTNITVACRDTNSVYVYEVSDDIVPDVVGEYRFHTMIGGQHPQWKHTERDYYIHRGLGSAWPYWITDASQMGWQYLSLSNTTDNADHYEAVNGVYLGRESHVGATVIVSRAKMPFYAEEVVRGIEAYRKVSLTEQTFCVSQDLSFVALPVANFEFSGMEYTLFDVLEGGLHLVGPTPFVPGAVDAQATVTFYSDPSRQEQYACHRAVYDIVGTHCVAYQTLPGATVIEVNDASDLSVGDLLYITETSGGISRDYVRIKSINGNLVTLEEPLTGLYGFFPRVARVAEFGGFGIKGHEKTVWVRIAFPSGGSGPLRLWFEYKK